MAKVPGVAYATSLVEEGKKVIWPKRELVLRHTGMVVAAVVVAAALFGGIDYGLQQLVILAIQR